MALFGFLKNIFGKGGKEPTREVPESIRPVPEEAIPAAVNTGNCTEPAAIDYEATIDMKSRTYPTPAAEETAAYTEPTIVERSHAFTESARSDFIEPTISEDAEDFIEPTIREQAEAFTEPTIVEKAQAFTEPTIVERADAFSEPTILERADAFSEPTIVERADAFSEPTIVERADAFSEPTIVERAEVFTEPTIVEQAEAYIEPTIVERAEVFTEPTIVERAEVFTEPTIVERADTFFEPTIVEKAAPVQEDYFGVEEALSEGDFPEELLSDDFVPPEAEDYDDDVEFLPDFEATPEVTSTAEEAVSEILPQVFMNSYHKISDIITVLRRYSGGVRILFCQNAAEADQVYGEVVSRGLACEKCTSDLPADAKAAAMEKAIAEAAPLIIDEITGLTWNGAAPACVIFCRMPASLAEYQTKASWAKGSAVFVMYIAADFIAARHRLLAGAQDSSRLQQLEQVRAWLAANGKDAKELNRQITAETTTEQAAGSCAAMTFVVTGKVYRFASRTQLKNYILDHGGTLGSGVSKDTNYLITNDTESGSAKNKKAAELGTRVITEDEFISLFCGGQVPGSKND